MKNQSLPHAAIISELEHWAPPALQENYDNAGLIVGDPSAECTGVLVCLDVTEAVIHDAMKKKCNLIVAHHPIVFSGLKRFNGNNLVERCVILAIQNNIGLYAIHTNLDNVLHGVNHKIANLLDLQEQKILSPKKNLAKIQCFVPKSHAKDVRNAMFDNGAGELGNYTNCSFNAPGLGSFKASAKAKPFVGRQGEVHFEEELKVEVIVQNYRVNRILGAMKNAHPYEEVAYDVIPISNVNQTEGAGIVGILDQEMEARAFLDKLKSNMELECFKYTPLVKNTISRVAVCGGSGSFLLPAAKAAKADIFITSDYKYHQFFEAENDIIIADIGHYESEKYTIQLILEYLQQKIPNFAVIFTEVNTNPIKYKF